MSISGLFPVILFCVSIIFSTILFLYKSKKQNVNEIRKIIREDSEKAIKNLERKVLETGEQVSLKQVEAQNTCGNIDKKIKELMNDSEELSQLGDALNRYRNMLAQLNIATSQTHEYVVKTSNDALKLQELKGLIDSYEKKTYEILQSFDSGIKEQHFQLETIKTEIQLQEESSINQIKTSRDDSLLQVGTAIESFQSICNTCNDLQSKHESILNELIEKQNSYEKYIENLNKTFEEKCNNSLKETINKLDEYLAKIQLSSDDKMLAKQDSVLKMYENCLNDRKDKALLSIDEVLKSSVQTLNLYNDKITNSYLESKNLDAVKKQSIDKEDDLSLGKETIFDNSNSSESLLSDSNSTIEAKLENSEEVPLKKVKKKKRHSKLKKSVDDNLDDKIDSPIANLENMKEKLIPEDLYDEIGSYVVEKDKAKETQKVTTPKNIEEINLDELASIDTSFSEPIKKQKPVVQKEEVEKETSSKVIINEKNEALSRMNQQHSTDDQIKKLDGTGFGNLLDSYGASKRNDNPKKKVSEVKSFKPGSIIEQLVEEDEIKNSKDHVEIDNKEIDEVPSITEEKKLDDDEKSSRFEAIGEEEEILLD